MPVGSQTVTGGPFEIPPLREREDLVRLPWTYHIVHIAPTRPYEQFETDKTDI